MKTIRVELSMASIRQAKEQIEKYANSLQQRTDELCRRLSEIGVEVAKVHVKVDTGELESKISFQRKGNAEYLVISDGNYAAFVEFGTGVIGSGTYKGELPAEWKYDVRRTPSAHDPLDPTAWYYYDEDGIRHRTQGQRAASYMAQASEAMRQKVVQIAREVFDLD